MFNHITAIGVNCNKKYFVNCKKKIVMKYLFLVILFVFAGCTMTKRVHQPGYHIEWKTKSIRNLQVVDNTTSSAAHSTSIESATTLKSYDTNVPTVSTVSEADSIIEQAPITLEKVSAHKSSTQQLQPKKIVKVISKPVTKIKSTINTNKSQYIGAGRTDLTVRQGLILLLCGAIILGIGILVIFIVFDDILALLGLFLVIIGGITVLISLALLLFSLIAFLLFG
jgi:ABC-type multidrug transport system fused ATPase/permease subunit